MLLRLAGHVRVLPVGQIQAFERAKLGEEVEVPEERGAAQAEALPTRVDEQLGGGEVAAARADQAGDCPPRPRQAVAGIGDGVDDRVHRGT